MKKSIIYLATLAALTTGGIAVMNTVDPSFISGTVAYAGSPDRAMLVSPLSDDASKYIEFFTNGDGGPSFIDGEQTAYKLDTVNQYTVRLTAPYIVQDNDDVSDHDNDKDYLTSIYEFNYVPNPNSGISNLQPIKVAYIYFDSDGNNVDDFYSKYVSGDLTNNTYSISDLKRDISNMSDSDFMQYGFGQHVDKHDGMSRSKLLNEINIILKYYLHEDVSDTPSSNDNNATESSASSNATGTAISNNANPQTNNNQKRATDHSAKLKQARQAVTKAKHNLKQAEKKGKKSAIKHAKQVLSKVEKHLKSVKK